MAVDQLGQPRPAPLVDALGGWDAHHYRHDGGAPRVGVYLPWIALATALCAVAFRRLPASYGAFAAAVLLVTLSSSNIDSFERYLLRAFPLAVAGALTLRSERGVWASTAVGAAGTLAYATAIFLGAKVP